MSDSKREIIREVQELMDPENYFEGLKGFRYTDPEELAEDLSLHGIDTKVVDGAVHAEIEHETYIIQIPKEG